MTKRIPCTCNHSFQDSQYGRGIRIFNEIDKQPNSWRCTVCSAVKVSQTAGVKKK